MDGFILTSNDTVTDLLPSLSLFKEQNSDENDFCFKGNLFHISEEDNKNTLIHNVKNRE